MYPERSCVIFGGGRGVSIVWLMLVYLFFFYARAATGESRVGSSRVAVGSGRVYVYIFNLDAVLYYDVVHAAEQGRNEMN